MDSVEHKAEGKMLLDVAESFMDELVHRSLVQVKKSENKEKSWSKYKKCSVHDLIRDLCLSKVKEEKFINNLVHLLPPSDQDGSGATEASIARRLCINPYNESVLKAYSKDMISHVRSLFVARDWLAIFKAAIPWPDKSLSLRNYKLLRIFTVQYFQFTKQEMKIISELVYLKCLSLRGCSVEELPSSISNLRNLEILNLRGTSVLHAVPNVLWKLKHLKYLYLPKKYEVVEKLRLKGLDELEVIHDYGLDEDEFDTNELIELHSLKVLSGAFYISDAELEKSILDFINSRELRHSDLIIGSDDELSLVSWLECCFINVLDIEAPICGFLKNYDPTHISSSCLSKLTLEGCKMEEDPMILLEKLPNLCKLYLYRDEFSGTEMVCSAQGFRKLENLSLHLLRGLKQWRVEEGAMPNLSSLEINNCNELEMVPEGLRYLAALKFLVISNMSVAFRDAVEGVDMYKISHVPSLYVHQ